MTSFSWKRKRNLKTDAAAAFREEREQEEEEAWEIDGVDWLTAAKRRRTLLLEDSESKSKRYRDLDHQQFFLRPSISSPCADASFSCFCCNISASSLSILLPGCKGRVLSLQRMEGTGKLSNTGTRPCSWHQTLLYSMR